MSARCRSGIATIHDYDANDLDDIRAFVEKCSYLVYGTEICPTTDRPHVHVVFWLKRQQRISVIHNMLSSGRVVDLKFPIRANKPEGKHFAPMYAKKGDQSKEEWHKDGKDGLHFGDNYCGEEFGDLPEPGRRTDLEALREVIEDAPNFKAVLQNTEVQTTVCNHLNYAKELFNAKKPKPVENFNARPWQQDLINRLDQDPDDRTILWMYDPAGAAGKTTMANYLVRNYGATILAGKAGDMFHAYDMEPIIIVDIPRSDNLEYLNYGAIEKLKDGIFFSGKYQSSLKCRDEQAHVIVFSNHMPDEAKWTQDRLVLIKLSDPPVEIHQYTDQFPNNF